MIITVVDFSIGSHIGVPAVAMLNIPMKVLFATTGMRMRKPHVTVRVNITPACSSWRIYQPIVALRGDKRMPPTAWE